MLDFYFAKNQYFRKSRMGVRRKTDSPTTSRLSLVVRSDRDKSRTTGISYYVTWHVLGATGIGKRTRRK